MKKLLAMVLIVGLMAVAAVGQTAGYVPEFTNSSGSVANSAIFQLGSNIGIGTTAPAATLHVVSSSTPAGFIDVYSNTLNAVTFVTRAARGTLGSPSAVQTDDIIGGFTARGWGTTGFSGGRGSLVLFHANEPWTDAAQSTYIQFNTARWGRLTDGANAYRQCWQYRCWDDHAGRYTDVAPGAAGSAGGKRQPQDDGGRGGGITFQDGTRQTTAAAAALTLSSPDGSVTVSGTAAAPTVNGQYGDDPG